MTIQSNGKIDISNFEKKLITEGYNLIPTLLNEDNNDLFIGPNNLLHTNKIEEARIFTKFIRGSKNLEKIFPNNYSKLTTQEIIDYDNISQETAGSISSHMIGFFRLGQQLTSHLNVVHGGAIATLVDEFFVKVVLPFTPDNFAVTAQLNIKYLKPMKFKSKDQRLLDVILECFIVEMVQNRKFKVIGSLKDTNGEKYCVGELFAIVPHKPL